MNDTFSSMCNLMQKNNYKLTLQRKAILNVLLKNPHKHISTEEVYEIVKSEHPQIGLATVYRTLSLLEELGVLCKFDFGDGQARYEIKEKGECYHYHLICINCGKILEIKGDELDSLNKNISNNTGFHIVDYKIKLYGYCTKCKKASRSRNLPP